MNHSHSIAKHCYLGIQILISKLQDNELIEKIDYIVNNPLKLGLIEDPDDYKWLVYVGGQLDLD